MQWLDRTPVSLLIIFSILFGLAPFVPEPHALEKIRMLVHGNLRRPLHSIDLVFHLLPFLLLLLRLARMIVLNKQHAGD
jgi:hypothetical protein